MAYALAADMVARFGELEVIQITDRNQDGQIDEDVARVALEDATRCLSRPFQTAVCRDTADFSTPLLRYCPLPANRHIRRADYR